MHCLLLSVDEIRNVYAGGSNIYAEGAETYANEHNDLLNHVAALESDSGAGHPAGFRFVGKPELEEWTRPVAQVLESIGASAVAHSREVGTDVDPLNQKGV